MPQCMWQRNLLSYILLSFFVFYQKKVANKNGQIKYWRIKKKPKQLSLGCKSRVTACTCHITSHFESNYIGLSKLT